ncbi:hypothetical protein [Demequina mangrovi]|uniref:Uncharacterized protein n=1 Tax=Demequina mangrovi TaxID=1043493 RepID=A0A1H6ULD5_9MICO|nr:hypothetical protein [Demequina mangrovi]SEI92496.1 hypothetical protein SAMN05421637_0431 [Demequina mangrovi]
MKPDDSARDGTPRTSTIMEVDLPFPTMVERGRARGGVASSESGRLVADLLHSTLGVRPRTADPKGFDDALKATFVERIVEGRREVVHVPRGLRAHADLGAVTGGQASLFRRASATRAEIVRILDGLVPLRNDLDPDDMDSYRAVVRASVELVVDEMGAAGGPRAALVDSQLAALAGSRDADPAAGPDAVGGQLGALRERFGLIDDHVNTVDDEDVLTAFWTLAEFVADLQRAWTAWREQFAGAPGQGFLGTELIMLSWLMDAAAEQVDELEAVLDSVMISEAERRTVMIDAAENLTLDGLLTWLRSFLGEHGRLTAQETGRDGIVSALAPAAIALVRAFMKLQAHVDDVDAGGATDEGDGRSGSRTPHRLRSGPRQALPVAMHLARVRTVVASLSRMLTDIAATAQRIGRFAQVVLLDATLTPVEGQDGTLKVTCRGLNLQPSYGLAFVSEPTSGDDAEAELAPEMLVHPYRASTSADRDSVTGLFRTRDLDDAGALASIGHVPDQGLLVPAEMLRLAIIDRGTGRTVVAPPPVSWPWSVRADAPNEGDVDADVSWAEEFGEVPCRDDAETYGADDEEDVGDGSVVEIDDSDAAVLATLRADVDRTSSAAEDAKQRVRLASEALASRMADSKKSEAALKRQNLRPDTRARYQEEIAAQVVGSSDNPPLRDLAQELIDAVSALERSLDEAEAARTALAVAEQKTEGK